MNRDKAFKRIRRKVSKMKPCPFCGKIPETRYRVDEKHSNHGSIGHFFIIDGCCEIMASGVTELFFCNNWNKPNFRLFCTMSIQAITAWNRRV